MFYKHLYLSADLPKTCSRDIFLYTLCNTMFNLLIVLAVQTKENRFYGTIYVLTLYDCSNGFDHMVNPIRVFTCPLGYILSIHVALLI